MNSLKREVSQWKISLRCCSDMRFTYANFFHAQTAGEVVLASLMYVSDKEDR